MTGELARGDVPARQEPSVSRYDNPEIIATIKQTVAKGATDAQLRMFLEVCKRTGLDPFLKEIWYVPEKGIIMAGRDGYLRVANENPQFDGMGTVVERDAQKLPIKATCTVWRKDRTHPIICEAYFNEYKKSSPVWTQYPSAMISKVAEVLALKRSFAINGVVSEEEIGNDGAGSREAAQAVAQAKIAAGSGATIEAPPVETTLAQDIAAHPPRRPKHQSPAARHIDMMQAFAAVKKRYQAIGMEKTYYCILERHEVHKSNEFEATEKGLADALIAYKEMSLNVAELEVSAAKYGGAADGGE
jgi:phage recombination protein Bet